MAENQDNISADANTPAAATKESRANRSQKVGEHCGGKRLESFLFSGFFVGNMIDHIVEMAHRTLVKRLRGVPRNAPQIQTFAMHPPRTPRALARNNQLLPTFTILLRQTQSTHRTLRHSEKINPKPVAEAAAAIGKYLVFFLPL